MHDWGTFEDSLLLRIPKVTDGRIDGKNIPTDGDYPYTGYIMINKNELSIKLLINDTLRKKLIEESWNGEYIIVR